MKLLEKYRVETLWIAVKDAAYDIVEEHGDDCDMEFYLSTLRFTLKGKIVDEVYDSEGNAFDKPIKMSQFALRGEDKKTCEAIFQEAIIEHKKKAIVQLAGHTTPGEWIRRLHDISFNVKESDIGNYIEGMLKQVWNAQLAANIVSGKPFQEILYFESTMQGNGKSTLMKAICDDARDSGLSAGSSVWPCYGYNNMASLQSNHLTYINDSTERDRDVDTSQIMAMIRREEVTTKEKYKPEITANAQGGIIAAGNRAPYATGRGWCRVRFNNIRAEEAAEMFNKVRVFTKDSNSLVTRKSLLDLGLEDFYYFTKLLQKTIQNKKESNSFSATNNSNKNQIEKIINICSNLETIQSICTTNNLDYHCISAASLYKHGPMYSNDPKNAISEQRKSNIANELYNLYKAGIIKRVKAQSLFEYAKYDITPLMSIDLNELDEDTANDFDIMQSCENEWQRWINIFDEFNGPEPNKGNERTTKPCAPDTELGENAALEREEGTECRDRNAETEASPADGKGEIEMTKEQYEAAKQMITDCCADQEFEDLALKALDEKYANENTKAFKAKQMMDMFNEPKTVTIHLAFTDGTSESFEQPIEEFNTTYLNILPADKRPFWEKYFKYGFVVRNTGNPELDNTIVRVTKND